ncbi:hypothetical protein ABZ714_09465 [Streptomyces sp. NPDC006798]|uniref:hypothetical protein n=1 Tax=Streptomyces sp. NPDC006798 TaxID=3155462 RepID=UPI0033FD5524
MSAAPSRPIRVRPLLRALPVEAFHDAFTRRLLAHRGLTTELLERHGGHPLRIRVLEQTPAAPEPADPALRAVLRLAPGVPALSRRTELVTPRGRVVSRNLVLGRLPSDASVAASVTGRTAPMGRALARLGVPNRRTLLTTGLGVWPGPDGAAPAAAREYLIHLEGEAPLYVQETFHPAVAPPHSGRAAPLPELRVPLGRTA